MPAVLQKLATLVTEAMRDAHGKSVEVSIKQSTYLLYIMIIWNIMIC